MHTLVGEMGLNGGSLAWHVVLLLQHLLLGCGLFQCMLGMFKPRGGRQLRHQPGRDLPCQRLSPHQLYSSGQSRITFQHYLSAEHITYLVKGKG